MNWLLFFVLPIVVIFGGYVVIYKLTGGGKR